MKRALIIVDVQYDFLPGGSLGVPDGDAVIAPLQAAAEHCDLVVASRDWHPADHASFSEDPQYTDMSWPAHCVQGTKGARIHPKLRKLAAYVISKGTNAEGPDQYSAFAGSTLRPVETLEAILKRYDIDEVIVGGLALDHCVRWTALDANAAGFWTIVPLDCTRGIDERTSSMAIEAFGRAGIKTLPHWTPSA